jgi:hypothetical protein
MYICNGLYVLVGSQLAWFPTKLIRATRTHYCVCTLLTPDDGQLESPKHIEV